jgi:hypothetical protein
MEAKLKVIYRVRKVEKKKRRKPETVQRRNNMREKMPVASQLPAMAFCLPMRSFPPALS